MSTPALVSRTREADGKLRPCCVARLPETDAVATAARVAAALSVPATGRPVRHGVTYSARLGLRFLEYAFSVSVSGRDWIGQGRPSDPELLNPENWRTTCLP